MDMLWYVVGGLALWLLAGVRIVEQQSVVIVQFLGRYSCTLEAGIKDSYRN